MRICGIIAEYNPLHNGHVHHMTVAKALSGADAVVVVLSGPFVQRGEAALFDPVTRARWAAEHGADLVIELPAAYACGNAESFALGGIRLLDQIGADCFSFGCENNDLPALMAVANCLLNEPVGYKKTFRAAIDSGKSFPSAQGEALNASLGSFAGELVSQPNNILAVEYLKACRRLQSHLVPVPVRRLGNGYHETGASDFPSSLGIRAALRHGIKPKGLPEDVLQKLNAGTPVSQDALWALIRYTWLSSSSDQFSGLPDMSEGLHKRIYKSMSQASSLEELIHLVQTKRYPASRICRALIHALIGITDQEIKIMRQSIPLFVRPLALGPQGREVLSEISRRAEIPIMTDAAHYAPPDAAGACLWRINRRAWMLYSVIAGKKANEDITVRISIS